MKRMSSNRSQREKSERLFACFGLLLLFTILSAGSATAQVFSSGSDGSDGIYAPTGPPGTVVLFDPSQFHGTQVAANIFNFTQITIPAGVTVKLSGSVINGPLVWLAQSDVSVQGTIDLSAGPGHVRTNNAFVRVPSTPGPGGYQGGVGGSQFQSALPGYGPGGGVAGGPGGSAGHARGGMFSGNQFLIPLVGGSGGGGGWDTFHGPTFDPGGGAGGGAILIASSTSIAVHGTIDANGGTSPTPSFSYGGGGSGGAIRLVAPTIAGDGLIRANGGGVPGYGPAGGGPGQVRLEADTISFSGQVQSFDGNNPNASNLYGRSTPFPLLLPTAGPPSAKVISINGIAISPNPNTFPDITINTAAGVPIVIQTHNIPMTATINLTVLNENGVTDTVIPAPPLGNCDQNNFCTTTVNVIFPFGASRGLTKVTWTP